MDARKCKFRPVRIYGRAGLFCRERLERASLPKGWHMYEVSHHAGDQSRPAQLGKMIMRNFYGTIVTQKVIRPPEGEWDCREIHGSRDFYFTDGNAVTLKEYEKQRKNHRR